jgi:DNA repair protein RecO
MRELYSRAVVLDRKDVREVDGLVHLFTEDYGKIAAWAKSVKKNTSKLSAHLQPLTFIKVRFIQRPGPRDGWSIVDCLRDDDFLEYKTQKRFDLVPLISFLNQFLFEFQPDRRLWAFLKQIFIANYPYGQTVKTLLAILGFNAKNATCAMCSSKQIAAFHSQDHVFLCESCSLKFPSNKLLLI